VIPPEFEYEAPETLDEAIRLLTEGGEDAKVLAGGHSLIPLMKLRLAAPTLLVDLRKLPGLHGIQRENGHFRIGALTTHHTVEHTPELGIAARATSTVADPQVRHRGTLGGSLAHADPASDLPAAFLALGGAIVMRGPRGERQVPVEEFFTGLFSTALEPDELVVEIRVPRTGSAGWAYEKFTRRANDWAIVAVAVVDGRVGMVNMGSPALRASATEAALASGASIPDAAALADQDTDPPSDLAATPAYRRHLARVLTRRALTTAAEAG
jgi:aerobic carbon-monoxide dehydrogenase medium subunit